MGNTLIIIEQQEGTLKKASLSAVAFGKQAVEALGGELHLLVMGPGAKSCAEGLRGYGANRIHYTEDPALEHYLAGNYAQAAADLARETGTEVVAASATAFGKDLMPRVAARLEAAMASDVSDVVKAEGTVHFKRPVYAGNAIVTVEVTTPVKVATVRGTEFDHPIPGETTTEITEAKVEVDAKAAGASFIEFKAVVSERPELTEADVVVSGGRGTKGPEGFQLIEGLADLLGGAVGATRAVVDSGWAPNDLQVGQTGKVVAPDLYFAIGISGAIQHLAGMKGSKTIVAINKDEEAPIFTVADYGLVADLFKTVPELVEEIKKAQAS